MQANVVGSNDGIQLSSGDSGTINGTDDTVAENGASDNFTVNNNGSGTNTIAEDGTTDFVNTQNQSSGGTTVQFNGASGYAGLLGGNNYTVNGSDGTIATWDNTGFNANGNSNYISVGNSAYGTIAGTGDALVENGASDSFTVNNNGSGTNTVAENGAGDFVNVQDQASGGTTVQFNASNDYAGLLSGTGYVVNGSNGTIATWDNTSFNAAGSNNTISASTGGTAAVIGSGNNIFTGSDTAVIVAGTGTGMDNIWSANNGAGDLTAAGQAAGVTILDGTSATVIGSNNTVLAGDDAYAGVIGNGNATIVGTNTTAAINGDFNQYAAVSGGTVYFAGVDNSAALNNTAVYSTDGNPITLTGASSTTGNMLSPETQAAQNADNIDEIYLEVLGRDVDTAGLADAQAQLVAGGSLDGIRTQLAYGTEAQGDFTSTLSSIGADAPSQEEINAFSAVMATDYDAPIGLIGSQGALANTSATNLLTELPVLETLDNGRTLSLVVAGNTPVTFQTTADLADFLYAVAVQKSQADSLVTDTFNEDINWLNQVDQPMLDVAEHWSDVAAYDTSIGNAAQATLANTASELALDIAAEPVGDRQSIYKKVSVDGHETKVTVYPGTNDPMGDATFHDIDPGIGGILEAAGVAILNIAAIALPETGLPYAAAAADAAIAGEDFANGQVLEGIISLASAAGGISGLLGYSDASFILKTAAQGVGGIYGAVQSAENGDPLGAVAGVLEAAAAAASGYAQSGDPANPFSGPGVDPNNPVPTVPTNPFTGLPDPGLKDFISTVAQGLSAGSAAVSISDEFASGNLAAGLISSLGADLSALESSDEEALSEPNAWENPFDGPGVAPVDEEQGISTTLDGPDPDNIPGVDLTDHRTVLVAGTVGAPGPSAGPIAVDGSDNSINSGFIMSKEGFETKAYVPHNNSGVVLGNSGVTVGGGVDLGAQSISSLQQLGVDPSTIATVTPYLGMHGQSALNFLNANPFSLSTSAAQQLTNAVLQDTANSVANAFNNSQDPNSIFPPVYFTSLPSDTKTAIVDLAYNYGLKVYSYNVWQQLTSGNWSGAVANLQNFGDPITASRRVADAALIQTDINSGALSQIHPAHGGLNVIGGLY